MSFICDDCHQPQRDGTYPVVKVVRRRRLYNGGFRIVKEIKCCPRCKHNDHGLITLDKRGNLEKPAPVRTVADLQDHFSSSHGTT